MTPLPPNGRQSTIEEVRRLEADDARQITDLAKRALEAIDAGPVRLFISFAYRGVDSYGDPTDPPLFGNTVVDTDFEPFEPDHIAGLQRVIEEHADRAHVIILHWQRVA